jgi:hypothetical protein
VSVPFGLVVIKPLSVGRGDAPNILEAILNHCPVVLRMYRQFALCSMTLDALRHSNNRSVFPAGAKGPSWICLFTHVDRVTNPTQCLDDYFGNMVPSEVLPGTLRHRYGGYSKLGPTAHLSDDVVHLAHETRADFEANLLFLNFDPEKV